MYGVRIRCRDFCWGVGEYGERKGKWKSLGYW